MPAFIDTHAHYFDRKFDPNPHNFNDKFNKYGGADAILTDPDFQAVVRAVINVGTNLVNSQTAVDMAGKYPFMAAAVGIHPEDAQGLPDGTPRRDTYGSRQHPDRAGGVGLGSTATPRRQDRSHR